MTEENTTPEETTALVRVDYREYGLEEDKAKLVEAVFTPMLSKMTELEEEYNKIIKLPPSRETSIKAKEHRMKYVRIRTATEKIHKEEKAHYLAGGRFVDGWKNAQLFASESKEKNLKAVEDHFANLEKERVAKLQEERIVILARYDVEGENMDLGTMEDDVWANFAAGRKAIHDAKIEAEAQAEAERELKRKKIEEERETQRLENERLKKEAEAREIELAAERKLKEAAEEEAEQARVDAQAKIDAADAIAREEREALEAERRAAEEKVRLENEETAKKAKAEADANLAKVNEEALKIQAEADENTRIAQVKVDADKAEADKKLKAAELAADAEKKEKERIAAELAKIVKCPECGHEFTPAEKE